MALVLLAPLAACMEPEYVQTLDMTTWSVVAIDPETGDVGVAMASCVQNTLADALGALVPGKGAAATQAGFNLANRNRVFAALQEGLTAEEVIQRAIDPAADSGIGGRQYGVVTMRNDTVRVAGFTGQPMLDRAASSAGTTWAGIRADAKAGVSVQGNTLVNEAVVANGLAAYKWDDPTGFNWITDRMMRALEAGSWAGGDVRCNTATSRQTAATAMIIAARGTDQPYAADSLRISDQGTPKSPWLAISYAVPRGADNPLLELRKRYDEWRKTATR
jgi:uncharacterized Ntn-hydrolase superfamily protein